MAGKRGPKTKEKVVDEIIRLKRRNPGYTASEIEKKLKKEFKDRKVFIPKERAITGILKKNQDKITPSPQDQPWSIGSCKKNDIPSSIIPLLINIQMIEHGYLTIREALWIAKLYPVLRPLLEKEYPEDSKAQISNLLSIVNAYSIREEIAEIHEQQSPDTSDLDEIFFIKGDVTPEATFRAEFDEIIPSGTTFSFDKEAFEKSFRKSITENIDEVASWYENNPDNPIAKAIKGRMAELKKENEVNE